MAKEKEVKEVKKPLLDVEKMSLEKISELMNLLQQEAAKRGTG